MAKELLSLVQYIPRALLLMVMIVPAYLYFLENRGKIKEKILYFLKQKWHLLFFFYLSLILISAIFSREITSPYTSIFQNFGIFTEEGINTEFIINISVFIPYSFLFLMAFRPRKPFWTMLLLSAITTCFIEYTQLVCWLGKFQLSDIVHNIFGGMIGYGVWCLVEAINKRKRFASGYEEDIIYKKKKQ